MKYLLCLANLLCFLALYTFSSVGLAVFRAHSISVAAEIAKVNSSPNADRTMLETLVLTTGNARFYYRTLANVAAFGGSLNVLAIAVMLWNSKRRV
jgi:hypothetical protein